MAYTSEAPSVSIKRGRRPSDHYAIISNGFLRDAELSFKARGIGAYLLSHAEGFSTTAEKIATANCCGVGQIRAGLLELEQRGYLVRERNRDPLGRVTGTDYLIQDKPVSAGQDLSAVSQGWTTQGLVSQGWETDSYKKTNEDEEDQLLEDHKRSRHSAGAPSTSPLTDNDQDMDCRPPSRQRAEGAPQHPQGIWDLTDSDDYQEPEDWEIDKSCRLFDLLDEIAPGGLEPNELNAAQDMLERGYYYRKIIGSILKNRGYEPSEIHELIGTVATKDGSDG